MATVAEIQAQIDAKKAQAASMPTGPAKQALLQEIDGLLQERQNAQLQDDPNALGPSSDLADPRISGTYTQDMGVADATHVVNPEGTDRVTDVDIHGGDWGAGLKNIVTNNPVVDTLKTFDYANPTKPLPESIPGLNKAPAPAPTSPQQTPTGGTTPAPGSSSSTPAAAWPGTDYKTNTYTDWWETHKGEYDKPSHGEEYINGVMGKVNGGPVLPHNTTDAYGKAKDLTANGPVGANNAYGVSKDLRDTPGAGETYGAQHINYFDKPGEGEKFGTSALDYFKNPGAGEDYIKNHIGFFDQPGMGEKAAAESMDILRKGGQGAQNIYDMNKGIQDWVGKNPINDEYTKYFAPGLRDKGYTENLYESGNQGLNQFYQRGLDKQTELLNRQMEARGLYNSGAAVRALNEAGADATANQAHDMAGLAAAADAAHMGRSGAALDWSKSGAADEIARHGLGLDYGKLGLDADKFNLDRASKLFDVGEGGQKLGENRVIGGSGLAKTQQDLAEGRYKTGTDIGKTVQDLGETRTGRGFEMGKGIQNLKETRLKGSVDAGVLGDKGVQDWAAGIMKNATDADTSARDDEAEKRNWMDLGNRITSTVDAGNLNKLNSGGNQAGGVQAGEVGKANDEFEQIYKVSGAKAGLTERMLSTATSEKGQAAIASLGVMLQKGAIDAQSVQDMATGLGITGAQLIKLYESTHPGTKVPAIPGVYDPDAPMAPGTSGATP